jgi:hypothetical protein
MPPWTIGCSIPNNSVNLVRNIALSLNIQTTALYPIVGKEPAHECQLKEFAESPVGGVLVKQPRVIVPSLTGQLSQFAGSQSGIPGSASRSRERQHRLVGTTPPCTK